jgi:type I thyroxine 5'-deiodinase
VPALNKLHQDYRDRAAFYVVYIAEAHPVDAWQLPVNISDDVLVKTTKTTDERYTAAGLCVKNLGIDLPAIIDGPDNAVEEAYTAWPDRLYVVDRDGRIAYKSGPGPWGFKPAEVEEALKRLLQS